jgi:hypothetical protein
MFELLGWTLVAMSAFTGDHGGQAVTKDKPGQTRKSHHAVCSYQYSARATKAHHLTVWHIIRFSVYSPHYKQITILQ